MLETVRIIWRTIDDILHARTDIVNGSNRHLTIILLIVICAFGGLFGAAVGSYGGVRPLQMIFSAVKFPMLLLLSLGMTIPSFYVFNALLGTHKQFRSSVRAIIATQTSMTIFLASLAPLTLVWYASGSSYSSARIFNIIIFAGCALYGWIMMGRFYRPLVASNPMHARLFKIWILQFVFVAIQLSWVLRPFIGKTSRPTSFIRDEAWGNAYLEIGQLVFRSMTG